MNDVRNSTLVQPSVSNVSLAPQFGGAAALLNTSLASNTTSGRLRPKIPPMIKTPSSATSGSLPRTQPPLSSFGLVSSVEFDRVQSSSSTLADYERADPDRPRATAVVRPLPPSAGASSLHGGSPQQVFANPDDSNVTATEDEYHQYVVPPPPGAYERQPPDDDNGYNA